MDTTKSIVPHPFATVVSHQEFNNVVNKLARLSNDGNHAEARSAAMYFRSSWKSFDLSTLLHSLADERRLPATIDWVGEIAKYSKFAALIKSKLNQKQGMTTQIRPNISIAGDTTAIEKFISELQDAIDTGDVELFNKRFANDILWGSPFAAIASGYEQIHSIHKKMFASVTPVKGAARYITEHIRFVTDQVAIAYVRRISQIPNTTGEIKPGGFDEMALFVLAKNNEEWWLAAAQHVPDKRDVYLR